MCILLIILIFSKIEFKYAYIIVIYILFLTTYNEYFDLKISHNINKILNNINV